MISVLKTQVVRLCTKAHTQPLGRNWRAILQSDPLPEEKGSTYHFKPTFAPVSHMKGLVSMEELAKEKSMFSATVDFAYKNGGPLTRQFLASIPKEYFEVGERLGLYPNIDVRVQRYDLSILKECDGEAFYPAVPGWHCDGEFRETYFSQPDLEQVPISWHIIATASTHKEGVSQTRFLNEPLQMDISRATQDYTFWNQVHDGVEAMENQSFSDIPDGQVTLFDARSLHTARPIQYSGGRAFFRMSQWHQPNLGEGQIGKHEQLYLLSTKRPSSQCLEEKSGAKERAAESFCEVVGQTRPHYTIEELATEQGMLCASAEFVQHNGGAIAQRLVDAVPQTFLSSLAQAGLKPRFDIAIFRLYRGYVPYEMKPDGVPESRGWKFGGEGEHPELHVSVSTHKKGVSQTELLASEPLKIADGELCLVPSSTARRKTPALNRGWSLLMRVVGVTPEEAASSEGKLITQQYVDPMTQSMGW